MPKPTTRTILSILDDEANVDVVYLDFAKAFDKVDHTIVLKKIKQLGIHGNIYIWIESFLTNRVQSVIVNGVTSDPCHIWGTTRKCVRSSDISYPDW